MESKTYIIEKTVSTLRHTSALRHALATVQEIRTRLLTGPANTLPHSWDSVPVGEVLTEISWNVAMTTGDADVDSRQPIFNSTDNVWKTQTRHGICATAGYLAGYYNILELLMKSFGSQYEAELHYFDHAVELLEMELEMNSDS